MCAEDRALAARSGNSSGECVLGGGRYLFIPRGPGGARLPVAADVPTGWTGWSGDAVIGPGNVVVVFQQADGLFRDPCAWGRTATWLRWTFGQPGDVQVGPAAIDLVNALQENSSYTSTSPIPVLLGGHQGYELEIRFPDNVQLDSCDGDGVLAGSHYYEIFSGTGVFPYFFEEGSSMHLFIVDVGATRVIATILTPDAAPLAGQEAARAIIESADFTP